MSVDPYMRGRMNAGEVLRRRRGRSATRCRAARSAGSSSPAPPTSPRAPWCSTNAAWRDVAVLDGRAVQVLPELPGIPPSYHLGVLGMPGLTAWAGLFRLAEYRAGDVVFVSGAAGAVGSLVGQFARLHGASAVIGSAGTPEKVRWLTDELGFTAAFDYHDGPVAKQLAQAAPDGIDVYFDNVGGEHLEAAIGAFKEFGRAALCGADLGLQRGRARRPGRATCP